MLNFKRMRTRVAASVILFCFASAAWCQLPSEVHTAAASEPSCAERLDDVQHQLIGLRADIKRISQTIDSTNEGLEIKSADALENAALNTSTLQDSQSLNARLAQAAVASAANAAAVQSRDQLVTTVCGFATVLFGLAITYLKGHLTSKKLETVLRASSETE